MPRSSQSDGPATWETDPRLDASWNTNWFCRFNQCIAVDSSFPAPACTLAALRKLVQIGEKFLRRQWWIILNAATVLLYGRQFAKISLDRFAFGDHLEAPKVVYLPRGFATRRHTEDVEARFHGLVVAPACVPLPPPAKTASTVFTSLLRKLSNAFLLL